MTMAIMAILSGSMLCGAPDGGWRAGTARVDITPDGPIWLAGYASRDHEAAEVLHPLWVKALALEDAQGRKGLLITSDHLGFPKELSKRIRDRIQESLGLERAQVILSASHTHSAPVLYGSLMCIYPMQDAQLAKVKAYAAQLEDDVAAAAEAAFANLKPAQVRSGAGVCRFAVNRRNNNEGAILETHNFAGPVDHSVPVIEVAEPGGEAMALVFGYACHCTVLSGYQICGDYAGFAQVALEEAYPGANAMFFAGCGADQNPLPRRSVYLARQYGEELAAAVRRALGDTMQPLEPELRTAYTETTLYLNDPPSREELEAVAESETGYKREAAKDLLEILGRGEPLRTSYPYPVQAWRLGGQDLFVLGGEVVVDYAVFIKKLFGADTFVMGYANDVMSYIPSVRVLEEGGYEGDTSQIIYGMPAKWREDIEERVMAAVREVAEEAGIAASE